MTDENTTAVPATITTPDLAVTPTATVAEAPASTAPASVETPTVTALPAEPSVNTAPVIETTPTVNVVPPTDASATSDSTPALVTGDIPASIETLSAPTDSAPAAHFSAMSIINGNKGLIIAAVLVIVVAIIGISAFIGYSSTDQYEGLIKRVEDQTVSLKARTQ